MYAREGTKTPFFSQLSLNCLDSEQASCPTSAHRFDCIQIFLLISYYRFTLMFKSLQFFKNLLVLFVVMLIEEKKSSSNNPPLQTAQM